MSSKSDQKILEMLYESINQFVLLDEEKKFVKECSKIILESIEHQVSISRFPGRRLSGGSSVIQFLFSSPVKDALEEAKLSLSKEERINFVHVFSAWFYKHVATYSKFDIQDNVERIVFEKVNNPNDSYTRHIYSAAKAVPFTNKEEILKNFEELFEFYIEKDLEYLKGHPSDRVQGYLTWREEKLKFQKLKQKLPEVEGLFD